METEETDLTEHESYRQIIGAAVEDKREWLLGMGFRPDDPRDRTTCEWLTWHLTKRF